MANWLEAEVREVVRETPTAATLRLDVDGWRGHTAGQHVDVRLTAEDGYTAQRSYSVSSAPEDGPPAITVERLDDGEVSPYLVDEAQPGDKLEVRGPVGGWFVWLASRGGPLLLVAGGSGLAPLMSMLRHRARAGSDVEARLLLSARTPDDVLFADELPTLGADVVTTYTRAPPARRVDRAMLADVAFPPEARAWTFVCGPTGFVERVAEDLVGLGHHASRIRTERFGATGG
jgi:ferredoxin-NADP reductase